MNLVVLETRVVRYPGRDCLSSPLATLATQARQKLESACRSRRQSASFLLLSFMTFCECGHSVDSHKRMWAADRSLEHRSRCSARNELDRVEFDRRDRVQRVHPRFLRADRDGSPRIVRGSAWALVEDPRSEIALVSCIVSCIAPCTRDFEELPILVHPLRGCVRRGLSLRESHRNGLDLIEVRAVAPPNVPDRDGDGSPL
jgi:hypothetical protein